MTADRELLELAAKAAGIRIKFFNSNGQAVIAQDGGGPESCLVTIWDPRVDCGQALRLAVRLSIGLAFNVVDGSPTAYRDRRHNLVSCQELAGEDAIAATCRAILRAAAEIGRAMTPHRCQYCEDKLCGGTGRFTLYGQDRPCDGIPF